MKSLELSDENSEILNHWFKEGVWNIESDNKETFLVIFGKSKIHIILRKEREYKKFLDKFLKFITF